MTRQITVVQVFELMGVRPTKEKTWAVGNRMQAVYAQEHGRQPPKDNRPKTGGGGSHCFALYPESYLPRIREEIARVEGEATAQPGLF